jgi:5'(3')-deoxyribonucleotidase
MNRPVVLLDADGVLLNFIQATLDTLHDIDPHSFTHDDIHTWEVFSSLPAAAQVHMDAVYDRLRKEGGRSIQPYPGAAEAVKELQDISDVIIVTSPLHGSRTWTHEREAALEKYFGISHENVIHAKRKAFVRGDALIDDKPSNLKEWREAHPDGKPIYWKNPQFREELPHYVLCTQSWPEVIAVVKKLARRK